MLKNKHILLKMFSTLKRNLVFDSLTVWGILKNIHNRKFSVLCLKKKLIFTLFLVSRQELYEYNLFVHHVHVSLFPGSGCHSSHHRAWFGPMFRDRTGICQGAGGWEWVCSQQSPYIWLPYVRAFCSYYNSCKPPK